MHPASKALLATLSPQQLAYVLDECNFVVALAPRRAGKSHANAVSLLYTMLESPESRVRFVTLTLEQATDSIWSLVKNLNAKFELEGKFNETLRSYELPNGSVLRLVGASDRGSGERFRGGAPAKVIIDECKSFRPAVLQELAFDVVQPMLFDYISPAGKAGGKLVLSGTPGSVLAGLFYEASTGIDKRWSKHFWRVCDNLAMPHIWEGMLADHKAKGESDDTPRWRREFLGEWVPSEQLSVFKVAQSVLPKVDEHDKDRTAVLGVRLELDGTLGMVVLSFHEFSPKLKVLWDSREGGLSFTQVAAKIKAAQSKFDTALTIVDADEFGKNIVARLAAQYDLDVVGPSDSYGRRGLIELINTDFRDGSVELSEASRLAEEMKLLQWENSDKIEWCSDTPSACCSAFLRAWAECQHRFSRPASPVATARELALAEEKASLERYERRTTRGPYAEELFRDWV